MGNDIEIKVKVTNATSGGLTSVNSSLQTLKTRADSASTAITNLRAATANDITLTAKLDDQTTAGMASLKEAVLDLQTTPRINLEVGLDDQTAAGITAVQAAIQGLRDESPIRLDATFDGQTADITAAAQSMRDLKDNAGDARTALTTLTTAAAAAAVALESVKDNASQAARELRTLRGRAAAAAASMFELRDGTTAASGALRTFNTRSLTSDGRLDTLSTRTRTLRGDMDDLDGSLGRVGGRMGALRGTVGSAGASFGGAGNGMQRLRMAAIGLAPALVPIGAAALAVGGQFVAGLGAAGVAVGVFGAAIGRQVAAMSKATAAETAYNDAVKEHGGAGSAKAAEAARKLQIALADMPQATQQAAAGLILFKESYKSWSDSTADSTMPVVTKSFATFGALLPRLTPLVRGTSTELDRMMAVLAGGIQSESFERFMASFAEFASGALAKTTSGLVKFSQSLNTGEVGRGLSEFMAYASEVGPAVGETLGNLAQAMAHLIVASGDLGVSVLVAVNALAELVNAIPSGALSTFIQVYAALKLASLGMALVGAAASSGALARLGAYFALMRTAGIATTLSATAASMSAMSKATLGLGVLAVAAIGIGKLAESARGAPPDVDRLTTSLKDLATTGKFTGELQKTFGDVDGLVKKYKQLGDAAKDQEEYVKSFGSSGIKPLDDLRRSANDLWQDLTKGEDSRKALTADFDAMDESLAGLVGSGNAEQAAKDFNLVREALRGEGQSDAEISKTFDAYKAALATLAAENRLAAEGTGLFGQQALAVQTKLDAQKASADGLAQSINALNNAALTARGGLRGMEAAMDAADAAFKKNGKTLDETTEKGRGNAQALDDIAAATLKAVESARANGASWRTVNGIYDKGRDKILALARGMTGSEAAAKKLANQILRTPDKTARLKGNMEDLQAKLNNAKGQLKRVPDSRRAQVRADIRDLQRKIAQARYELSRVNGMNSVATITTRYVVVGDASAARRHGSHGSQLKYAQGGPVRGYADGGDVQGFPTGGPVAGPGTERSDSIPAWLSDGEYVIKAEAVRKYGLAMFDSLNSMRLADGGPVGYAKGGLTKRQKAAAKAEKDRKARAAAAAKAERDARSGAQGDLTISHFGKMAGYQRSEFGTALGKPDSVGSLVNALNQWRGIIMKATHGGTERRLLRQLDSTGRALLKQERALTKVTDQLDKARSKLADLKSAAASLASSVKNNILGSANITKGASGEGRVTTASIMSGLTSSRDKATAFSQALKELQKKGLRKDLLSQIAEAGVDGGGLETATAVLGASGSEIKSMNDLQGQITTAATAAGKTTADAVFKAQIKAQEKAVTALKGSQGRLTKSMDNLTKVMEKAIEKAFGKKVTGGIVGAASGGVRGGWTITGEEGPEMVRLPVGSRVYPTGQSKRMAWESMLNEPQRSAPRPTRGAGGGGRPEPVVIELRSSGSDVDEFLLKILRRAIRVRGGNAQVILGRAGA